MLVFARFDNKKKIKTLYFASVFNSYLYEIVNTNELGDKKYYYLQLIIKIQKI